MIDDEQGVFKAGRGCVDRIFTLKQISEKASLAIDEHLVKIPNGDIYVSWVRSNVFQTYFRRHGSDSKRENREKEELSVSAFYCIAIR